MPTLNLKKKTKKEINQRNEHTPNRELRQKYYNTTEWRKLREAYLKQHPVCEECLNKGKVTPAEDIHHRISPFKNGECNKALLLDYNNLMSLCKKCHNMIHSKQNNPNYKTVEEQIKELETLMSNTLKDNE